LHEFPGTPFSSANAGNIGLAILFTTQNDTGFWEVSDGLHVLTNCDDFYCSSFERLTQYAKARLQSNRNIRIGIRSTLGLAVVVMATEAELEPTPLAAVTLQA
jgi:hypothetical protein